MVPAPVGMLLIGAAVVIVGPDPAHVLRRGDRAGAVGHRKDVRGSLDDRRASAVDHLGPAADARRAAPPAVQAELGEAGEVASVTAPASGDQVTVTWDIQRAGSQA